MSQDQGLSVLKSRQSQANWSELLALFPCNDLMSSSLLSLNIKTRSSGISIVFDLVLTGKHSGC